MYYRNARMHLAMRSALLLILIVALMQMAGDARAQVPCLTPLQAIGSVGQLACVEGVVTNAFYARQSNGQPTFLDMGNQFTAVIWGDDRPAFNPAPETWRGQRLRVIGVVSQYRGKAQIIVSEPSQLGPAGGPPPLLTPARTPTATPMVQALATTTATAIPTTVETPTPAASATVEAVAPQATPTGTAAVRAPESLVAVATKGRPGAAVTEVATAVSRARVDVARQSGGPSWLMIAGGLGLVAVGAGGALVLTRRRPRGE